MSTRMVRKILPEKYNRLHYTNKIFIHFNNLILNLEVLKPKQNNHRSEYPSHFFEDDDEDDMNDYDYEEVPKSHHRLH